MEIKQIQDEIKKAVDGAQDVESLDQIWRAYLGSKGVMKSAIETLKDLPASDRPKFGQEINRLKDWAERVFEEKRSLFKMESAKSESEKDWMDISLPGKKVPKGHLHPLTHLRNQVESIFTRMGFEVAEGPEVEDEWHNFDALNIPKDHPARDLWDTFWIKYSRIHPEYDSRMNLESGHSRRIGEKNIRDKFERMLLRTHTSPVQIRYMETHEPPFRIIAPGRVFRHEATDASHGFQLHQAEGLMVGEDVSVANFKAIITEFYRQLFRKDVSIRLRPSFFPFVEPGFEVDMSCIICNGKGFILSEQSESKGCSTCSRTGWLEMMGAGMVHPNVFKNVGYNPAHVQGFAFGMGLDRLAMMRYKIPDIRMLFSMDTRFLEQF